MTTSSVTSYTKIVIFKTVSATSDKYFVKITWFPFLWKFLSPATPQVVILTTFSAARDEKILSKQYFCFSEWLWQLIALNIGKQHGSWIQTKTQRGLIDLALWHGIRELTWCSHHTSTELSSVFINNHCQIFHCSPSFLYITPGSGSFFPYSLKFWEVPPCWHLTMSSESSANACNPLIDVITGVKCSAVLYRFITPLFSKLPTIDHSH